LRSHESLPMTVTLENTATTEETCRAASPGGKKHKRQAPLGPERNRTGSMPKGNVQVFAGARLINHHRWPFFL
ncbi:MAG: hypothetical protein VXB09_12340, partial [Gammaproteobacteria bacterium]